MCVCAFILHLPFVKVGVNPNQNVLYWKFGCFDATTSGKLDKVANAAKVLDIRLTSS